MKKVRKKDPIKSIIMVFVGIVGGLTLIILSLVKKNPVCAISGIGCIFLAFVHLAWMRKNGMI